MPFLVRKITKSKWLQYDLSFREPSADAITNCLKTSCNTISTWEILSHEDLDYAVLAIVSSFERLETIDVVHIEKSRFESNGLELNYTEGDTIYTDFKNNHIDVINLSYNTLGPLSQLIIDELINENIFRRTFKQLKNLIYHGVEQGLIDYDALHHKIKRDVFPVESP